MQATELATLLAEPEGDRLAFLRERSRLDDVAETLVAFANRSGGTVIFGVSGRGRARIEGLREPAAVRELVLEAALACTPPLILPLPELVHHEDAALLVAAVPAGLSQVYALHGKYLRREGATNQPLTPDALRRLLLDRGDVAWDRSIALSGTMNDLDPQKIAAYAARIDPAAADEPWALLQRRGCVVVQESGFRIQDSGLRWMGRQGDKGTREPTVGKGPKPRPTLRAAHRAVQALLRILRPSAPPMPACCSSLGMSRRIFRRRR